jgi:GAF domain-containing protein
MTAEMTSEDARTRALAQHPEVLSRPERLQAIADIDLFNPELRELLNAVTKRSAEKLEMPTSLVTIVLDSALFVLASSGLKGWIAEAQGVPAEWAFCAHTVVGNQPYVVHDTTVDPVEMHNPLVLHDGVHAYAGVPLVSRSGQVLGAHCVLGSEAEDFTDDDVETLASAAEEIVEILSHFER